MANTTQTLLDVADAIVANLSAASALGSSVGKNYSVIETTQSIATVISWKAFTTSPTAYGYVRDLSATFLLENFIKDTGSASAMLDLMHTAAMKIMNSIEADPTLQGKVDEIGEIRTSREPGEVASFGSISYLTFSVEIDVTVFGT